MASAKIVQSVEDEEAKFYAANQVADEARHVEVYHRYLTEKLGLLRFENEKDSTQEMEARPPAEFLELLGKMISTQGAPVH